MEDEFQKGDELATAGDRVALEYGWWANEWLFIEAGRSDANPESRAAFSYALTILEGRHGKYLSRSQITDRIRIGRVFPEGDYKDLVVELHYNFTFSQLRAAYVREDKKKTMDLLLWAAGHDADPMEINSKKMGSEAETGEAKAWRHLVEWADKYLQRCTGFDGERCRVAREVVKVDQKERNEKAP